MFVSDLASFALKEEFKVDVDLFRNPKPYLVGVVDVVTVRPREDGTGFTATSAFSKSIENPA